jgi:signal transduction histidine kinase
VLWSGGIGGLWRIHNGRRDAVPLPADVPDPDRTAIFSLLGGPDGALWVSFGRRGLYTLRDGRWQVDGGVADLADLAPTVMAGDAAGRIWFGSTDDRVTILERGTVRHLGRAEGLRMGTVLAILPVAGGAWIGGENGLAWYDGQRFVQVAGRGGDGFTGITGLVLARDGALWLNGGAGISAIDRDELARAVREPGYQPPFTRLDYRDGLPGTASGITPLPSAVRDSDGRLWFSTTGGAVAFDPETLPRNTRVPPVVITALRADGTDHPARDGIRLAPHTGTLEIAFSALTYRAPERVRVRYRLEGVDAGWQTPEGRRSAHYTNLPPGRYRFAVTAANDDGLWNREGAALSFEVAPSLTQTLAFRVTCALLLAGGLWLLHRMRLRRVAQRIRMRMNERLAERERIARELHDTLLQSVQGLILKVGGSLQRLRADERAPIEAALDDADRVLAEGRDRVAGLRGAHPGQGDLATAIADAVAALNVPVEEGGARFDLQVLGRVQALETGVGDEVFAVAREALRNAFAHAHATTVTVTLDHRRTELFVRIADDGRGIAPDVLAQGARPGHWGMPGMRERAAGIGTLELQSQAGVGTTWCLRVPLRRAWRMGRRQRANAV